MTSVFVVVEGPTEEGFVKDVLAPSLEGNDIFLTPVLVQNTTGFTGSTGGVNKYGAVQKHVANLLNVPEVYVTTLFDYYGLPTDFPGMSDDALPPKNVLVERLTYLEERFTDDLGRPDRFIPYFQLHEFEALLFSDVQVLDRKARALSTRTTRNRRELERIVNTFRTPEDINDDPSTAPSKRILRLYSGYRKVPFGQIIAEEIGLDTIRQKCPRFDRWVTGLENL